MVIYVRGAQAAGNAAYWYAPASVTVAQKDAVFNLINDSPGKHDFTLGTTLKGEVLFSKTLASNTQAVIDLTFLAPGKYTFWCSVLDHADMGQVGTLTIPP